MSYIETNTIILEKEVLSTPSDTESNKDAPKRFNHVEVLYKLLSPSREILEEEQNPEHPYSFKVGAAHLIKGINIAVTQMAVGEKALFKLPKELTGYKKSKGYQQDGLTLEIELISCEEHEPDRFDLEDQERLPFALKYKQSGTEYYREGNLEAALERFQKALDTIEWVTGHEETTQVKVALLFNVVLLLAKTGRLMEAVDKGNWVVNMAPENPKSYFRRGNVLFQMEEYDKAILDFKKGLELEPSNTSLKKSLKEAKKLKREFIQKNCDMFSKSLKKEIYEEKVVTSHSDSLNPIISAVFRGDKNDKKSEKIEKLENSEEELGAEIRVELFRNIMPDTVNYLEAMIQNGFEKFYLSDYKALNFCEFKLSDLQLNDKNLGDGVEPENYSIKFKKKGYLYFRVEEMEVKEEAEDGTHLGEVIEEEEEEEDDEDDQMEEKPTKAQIAVDKTSSGPSQKKSTSRRYKGTVGITLGPLPWFDDKNVIFGHISSKGDNWEKLLSEFGPEEAEGNPLSLTFKLTD